MMETKYAHLSLCDVLYCAVSQIHWVARKDKSITRTLHFIGASELFDNLTGFRSLPNDIKGVEGGNDVASITFLQREKEKKIRNNGIFFSSWGRVVNYSEMLAFRLGSWNLTPPYREKRRMIVLSLFVY
jgi:hypothetical protein